MKRIYADSGAGKPHPQGLAKRRRRIDRDHLDAEPPLQRTGFQPVPDTGAVLPIDYAKDLPGIQIHDGRHPGLEPLPGLGFRVLEEAHGPGPVLIDAQHHRGQSVHIG